MPSLWGNGLLKLQDGIENWGWVGSWKHGKLLTSWCLQDYRRRRFTFQAYLAQRHFNKAYMATSFFHVTILSSNPWSSLPFKNPQPRIIRAIIKKERLLTFCDVWCYQLSVHRWTSEILLHRSRVGFGICVFYQLNRPQMSQMCFKLKREWCIQVSNILTSEDAISCSYRFNI